jgi:hypothetical protein
MIIHIVSFKLKPEFKDKAILIKQALETLKDCIPQIVKIEVGINLSKQANAFDLVLNSEFNSLEDIEIYRVHPEHEKVLKLIALYKQETMVVDYQI